MDDAAVRALFTVYARPGPSAGLDQARNRCQSVLASPLARAVLVLSMLALLGGCAAAQKRACEAGDWEGLGYQDGVAGRSFERIGRLADRCSDYDITVDTAAWARGHERGMASYCAPERGFDLGEAGADYSGHCPSTLESGFLRSYVRGLGIRRDELNVDYDTLQRDIEAVRRNRMRLDIGDDPDRLDNQLEELEADIGDNLVARRELNRRIARWSRDL